MKTIILHLGWIIALATSMDTDGVIKAPISRNQLPQSLQTDLHKRASSGSPVSSPLHNMVEFYALNIQIGTPAQNMTVMLDTGSSDLWVYGVAMQNMPRFDSSKSQTWHNNNTQFRIRYVTGSAKGKWGTDTVTINNAHIHRQSFAVVTTGTQLQNVPGLMGVGLIGLESVGTPLSSRYVNVPTNLFYQGYIRSPTYSLYLDDPDSKSGSIVFGGIDHAKYEGQLYSVPRVDPFNYEIRINSINATKFKTSAFNAVLDSGTTLGLLPNSILNKFESGFRLHHDVLNRYYYLDSKEKIPDEVVKFDFSGAVFSVKLASLFVKSENLGLGKGRNVLGFTSSEDSGGAVIFGDVFLRNFYVVYDAGHPQIGLALASFKKDRSSVEAISGGSIPRSMKAPQFNQDARLLKGNGGLDFVHQGVLIQKLADNLGQHYDKPY
jgi:hypothetical protein